MKSQRGFTMVEILMVVLVVGILAAVAVPQFVDFSSDAKNAAVQSAVGTLRSAISNQYAQIKLRCNPGAGNIFPTVAQLNANNITSGNNPCTTAEIPQATDRKFVAGTNLPDNPWSAGSATQKRTVYACVGATTGCSKTDATACDGNPYSATSYGWCYNATTGEIWANTAANGFAAKEYTY